MLSLICYKSLKIKESKKWDIGLTQTAFMPGYEPKNGEPRVLPIVQSTTYKYDTAQAMGDLFDLKADGFFYTRIGNPTLDAVEKKIAVLEGGVGAMLTSSGQAASLLSVWNICHSGDHMVSSGCDLRRNVQSVQQNAP